MAGKLMTNNRLILDPPEPLGQYLGCGQRPTTLNKEELDRRMEHIRPLYRSKGYRDNSSKPGCAERTESEANSRDTSVNSGKGSNLDAKSIRYDMVSFFESCCERYLELTGKSERDITPSKGFLFPGIDDHQLKEGDWEKERGLASISAKVLIKALYGARTCRWLLLHSINALAREVAKWNQNCDISNMNFKEIMEKINEILQIKKNEEKNVIIKNDHKIIK